MEQKCRERRLDVPGVSWKASGKGGVVVAGGSAAVAAGTEMLAKGGNAADAAVATILALSITDYGSFCIGAEVPFIIYDATKREVKVLSGLGGAPSNPDAIKWYYEHGIPGNGGMKAAPVPAAISLCFTALKLYGTMTFEEVVRPTLALLDTDQQDWHKKLKATLNKLIKTERKTTGNREEKLQVARDRFYKGDIACELAEWYIKEGGFLRKADLAAHVTRVEDPIIIDYRGYTVCKCDTWTQGPVLSQTLRILEKFDLKKMGHLSADYIHVCTEALKLAFADRDKYYGDPRFADVPIQKLLSDEYTNLRWPLIDMAKASSVIRPGDPINMKALLDTGKYRPGVGGTTTCCVADRWGNLVAATPSGNTPYITPPGGKTGVTHGNRLRSLNTTKEHANCIKAGKRPRITLTPTIVLKDTRPILAISVAGGDLQDQVTLNVLLNFVEFNMMPDDAVTSPRFRTGQHEDSFNPDPDRDATIVKLSYLEVNPNIDQRVKDKLINREHNLSTTSKPIACPVMLYIDQGTKMLYGAGDPEEGRHAAALDNISSKSGNNPN